MKNTPHASIPRALPAPTGRPKALVRGARARPAPPARAHALGRVKAAASPQPAAPRQEEAAPLTGPAATEAMNHWAEDRLARLGIPWPEEA